MTGLIADEKIKFFTSWTLLSFGTIPLSYMISLIVELLVHGAFGFNQMEMGTPLSQTLMQIAGGAVLGCGTGLYQKSLLRKLCKVTASWIYTLVAAFVVTELVAGIVFWQMHINRSELRFIEFNPLPESLIFAVAGLLTGLLQWTILRRFFFNSVYWIVASTLGWGICVLVTKLSVWAFFPGALLYGLITAATLMWILRRREPVR